MAVGVSADGRNHGGLFSLRAKGLDPLDDLAPVRMAERRIDRGDVIGMHAFGGEICAQDPVGHARIVAFRSEQNPALDIATLLAHQIANGRNRLLARRRTGVEDMARAFLALVLNGIEQQAVQSLEHRNDGFPGSRGPAAEYDCDLFVREQLAGLVGKGVPVRRGVDDDRLQFPAEQPALFVLVRDHHQDRVLQHGFADGHGAGQGMQNADLDGVFCGVSHRSTENKRHRERSTQGPSQLHADAPTSSKMRVSLVMPLATTASKALNSN